MPVWVYVCRGCNNNGSAPLVEPPRAPLCPFCGQHFSFRPIRASGGDFPGLPYAEVEDGDVVSIGDLEDAPDPERIVIGGTLAKIDEVLGGGIVPGQSILFSGPPGIGKSTLLLQVLHRIASQGIRVLFVCGEESPRRIGLRFRRLGLTKCRELKLVKQVQLDEILHHVSDIAPRVVVIDSVNSIECTSDVTGEPLESGTALAIKHAMKRIHDHGETEGVAFVVIGHVTGDDTIAGGRRFQHDVDTVLFFDGREDETLRTLKVMRKNRWGGALGVARFEMGERGLNAVE